MGEVHPGRTALYRHRDCNGTLLYVGISLSVAGRLAQHASTSHWFAEVAQVDVEYFPTREAAMDAERRAIQTEYPRCNQVHAVIRTPKPARPLSKAREKVRIVRDAPPAAVIRAPYKSQTFRSVREARTMLYREAEKLAELAEPLRETYGAVMSRHPKDTSVMDLGHRFWLRLSDQEFESCRWCVLADEAAFFLDHCEFMEEDDDWICAADDLWGMFCVLTFKWASRRDELEFRWPELAAA
jgi:predicted GIY-YIG superfamily endonuclease